MHETLEAQRIRTVGGDEGTAIPALEVMWRPLPSRPVCVRPVWADNLTAEFALIRACVGDYPLVAMDTEFPGVVHRTPKHPSLLSAAERYSVLKINVDQLKLIQFGLVLSDARGELPTLGTDCSYVWEFNFKDFDILSNAGAPESIELLKTSGIDFARNRTEGIDSRDFVALMTSSGLLFNGSAVSWVTFDGAYDFAYVIKAMMEGHQLPGTIHEFLSVVRAVFGEKIYDLKHLMKYCNGLYGGLDRVAGLLRVERVVGKRHQAGSDSLLTLQSFLKMREFYFKEDGGDKRSGVVFGLEVPRHSHGG